VSHCHWSVYLWVHDGDAGEVEVSGGVDTSGGGAYNVHPGSRNWRGSEKVLYLMLDCQLSTNEAANLLICCSALHNIISGMLASLIPQNC